MYLPEYIGENRVLVATEAEGEFLVDGSQVGAPPGNVLAYRNSQQFNDKNPSYNVAFGTNIKGTLRDGWLEVEVVQQVVD